VRGQDDRGNILMNKTAFGNQELSGIQRTFFSASMGLAVESVVEKSRAETGEGPK
jgi:hypothetical protein